MSSARPPWGCQPADGRLLASGYGPRRGAGGNRNRARAPPRRPGRRLWRLLRLLRLLRVLARCGPGRPPPRRAGPPGSGGPGARAPWDRGPDAEVSAGLRWVEEGGAPRWEPSSGHGGAGAAGPGPDGAVGPLRRLRRLQARLLPAQPLQLHRQAACRQHWR